MLTRSTIARAALRSRARRGPRQHLRRCAAASGPGRHGAAPALWVWAVVALGVGCAQPRELGPSPVIATQEGDARGRAVRVAWRAQPPSPVSVRYRASWDERTGWLTVEAEATAAAGARFAVEPDLGSYFHDLAAAPAGQPEAWQAPDPVAGAGERGQTWLSFAPCGRGPCRVRYRMALRQAAEALRDVAWAGAYRGVLIAPPSTWLLAPAPREAAWAQRLQFSVATAGAQRFAVGLPRSADGSGWEIELRDLWTSPYAAFGELRVAAIDVPGADGRSAKLQIAIAGQSALGDDALRAWVARAAGAVASYWGRFPMPDALVILAAAPGRRIGGGRTLSGGGGSILLGVGREATLGELAADWVLVHELVHLSFPSMPRHQRWAEEGLATYLEPLVRARAGLIDEREAWRSLVDGLPYGLLEPGGPGLDRTQTWGATYWGGALFWMLGDLELRRRTQNRYGLEHALRGVLAAPGGNGATRWPLVDVLEVADRAAATSALLPLYERMGERAIAVELSALWRELGVVAAPEETTLDDTAPLAAVRRAMALGQ